MFELMKMSGSHFFTPTPRMTVWLSTAPTEPLTHWYQVRCLLQSPLFAKAGDTLSGTAMLVANKRCVLHALFRFNSRLTR